MTLPSSPPLPASRHLASPPARRSAVPTTGQEARRPGLTSGAADLARHGLTVLPASHAVPVLLWLRTAGDDVLLVTARGTRIALNAYRSSDLTAVLLRSECNCPEHRRAGAAWRTVLRPGAEPWHEARLDGADRHGWRGYEAGLLTVAEAMPYVLELLAGVPGLALPGARR
jgi:hypothetical protein